VAVLADTTLTTFDLKTGQPVYDKQVLPHRVTGVPQFLEGDDPRVLLVAVESPVSNKESYVLRSLRSGKELWRKPLPPYRSPWDLKGSTFSAGWEPGQAHWSLIADLDGKGGQSVILIQQRNAERKAPPWVELAVEVLDAATGKTRWEHECSSSNMRSGYFL